MTDGIKKQTLKAAVYEICYEIAAEFPGWSFSAGQFKNQSLKHSTLIIAPGFHFTIWDTPLQPSIWIKHKRSVALFKRLNGYEMPTSLVNFQTVPHLLEDMPEHLRLMSWILADKDLQMSVAPPTSEQARKSMVDVTECRHVLHAMMRDGIRLIEELYDLASEDDFLRNLPPKYTTRSEKLPYDEYEKSKGVMICVVRALMGDLDFVRRYMRDDYVTVFPKKIKELESLIEVLPQFKNGILNRNQ